MAFSALRRPSQFDRSHFRQAVPPRAFQGRFCAFPETPKTGGRIRALEGPASFLTLQKWRKSHEDHDLTHSRAPKKGTRGADSLPPAPGRHRRTRARLLPPRLGEAEDVPALRGRFHVGAEAPPGPAAAGQAHPPRQAPGEVMSTSRLCLLPLPSPSTSRRALELHLLPCLLARPAWCGRRGGGQCPRIPGVGLAGCAGVGSRSTLG